MAHYRHLPIWKAAMGLAVHLEHAVRRFGKTPSPPRYHKYTLGSELRLTAQRLCRLEARANNAAGDARFAALDQLVLGVEEMKTLLNHAPTAYPARAAPRPGAVQRMAFAGPAAIASALAIQRLGLPGGQSTRSL